MYEVVLKYKSLFFVETCKCSTPAGCSHIFKPPTPVPWKSISTRLQLPKTVQKRHFSLIKVGYTKCRSDPLSLFHSSSMKQGYKLNVAFSSHIASNDNNR